LPPPPPVANSFLAQLDPGIWATIAARTRSATYPPRTQLFHQGDPAGHVVVLIEGWVKVTSTSRAGKEALLALRGPGDILGDLAAVDGLPRSATVTALFPVTARVIDGQAFVKAVTDNPPAARALLRHLARGLRESDRRRLEFVSASGSARLAALLLQLADQHGRATPSGVVIDLPLSQRELATAAAISREAVARTIRALRERDLIRTRHRGVVLRSPEVLRSLARDVSDDAG